MTNILERRNQPILLALTAGAVVGLAPLFVDFTAPAAQAAHFLGAVCAILAVKSMARPDPSDWLGFVLFGVLLGLAPFFATAALPFETVKWLMVAIGVTMALAGFWQRWLVGEPIPAGAETMNEEPKGQKENEHENKGPAQTV